MSAEYDGAQIVGIDLHRRRSVIVRMTETGKRLDSVRIDNDPMVLPAEIGSRPARKAIPSHYRWRSAALAVWDSV